MTSCETAKRLSFTRVGERGFWTPALLDRFADDGGFFRDQFHGAVVGGVDDGVRVDAEQVIQRVAEAFYFVERIGDLFALAVGCADDGAAFEPTTRGEHE